MEVPVQAPKVDCELPPKPVPPDCDPAEWQCIVDVGKYIDASVKWMKLAELCIGVQ